MKITLDTVLIHPLPCQKSHHCSRLQKRLCSLLYCSYRARSIQPKLSGNFGPKLNESVRSNRKSFRKTGPPFEVVLFSRSDRLEFWLNGSRPQSHCQALSSSRPLERERQWQVIGTGERFLGNEIDVVVLSTVLIN